METPALEARALVKQRGSRRAVDGVSFAVAEGELLALVGPSGCGKTTTLKMLNRLLEPTSGEVHVLGENAASIEPHLLRRRIGYVFQDVGLFPHRTVAENVAVPLRLAGWDRAQVQARVAEVLALVGLDADCAGRWPGELSGGQQQRVGVARALAAAPRLMLLDEPFGALDPITRDSLQQSFQELRRRLGLCAVLVTHDMAEALLLADRVGVMREGRLVQIDSPAALLRAPADEHVARLLETPRRQAQGLEALLRSGS